MDVHIIILLGNISVLQFLVQNSKSLRPETVPDFVREFGEKKACDLLSQPRAPPTLSVEWGIFGAWETCGSGFGLVGGSAA
jgi:hypothetical protein